MTIHTGLGNLPADVLLSWQREPCLNTNNWCHLLNTCCAPGSLLRVLYVVISCSLPANTPAEGVWSALPYTWGPWDMVLLGNLLKATQVGGSNTSIWTRQSGPEGILTHHSAHCHCVSLLIHLQGLYQCPRVIILIVIISLINQWGPEASTWLILWVNLLHLWY